MTDCLGRLLALNLLPDAPSLSAAEALAVRFAVTVGRSGGGLATVVTRRCDEKAVLTSASGRTPRP